LPVAFSGTDLVVGNDVAFGKIQVTRCAVGVDGREEEVEEEEVGRQFLRYLVKYFWWWSYYALKVW
jgi:hypothetical protein